jgi:hypothetical protein
MGGVFARPGPDSDIDLDRAVHRRASRRATPGVESRSLVALSLA